MNNRFKKIQFGVSIHPEVKDVIITWVDQSGTVRRMGDPNPTPGSVISEMVRVLTEAGWKPGDSVQVANKKEAAAATRTASSLSTPSQGSRNLRG